jgi:hypothetical protein
MRKQILDIRGHVHLVCECSRVVTWLHHNNDINNNIDDNNNDNNNNNTKL